MRDAPTPSKTPLGEGDDGSLSNAPTEETARRATGWLNETFTILQSGVGPNQVEGSNCIHFDVSALRQVRSGWVNVTWTTPSAASQQMRLVAQGEGSPVEAVGPSPLRLELRDVRPHPQLDLTIYLRTDLLAGADVEVDMHLQWTFDYEGAEALTIKRYTCG